MFGMSSKDFWEGDPQLYWAYRTFYLKQKEIQAKEEMEKIKYSSWLNGNMNYMSVLLALQNSFGKNSNQSFPTYNKCFPKEIEQNKEKQKKDMNLIVQEEFNFWARY